MKINFLFSDFRPSLKCGEAISAVTSVLSGTYNAKQSQMNVHSQLNAQSSENAINRDWQTAQAEIARQYNTAERLAAQQWSEHMLDKQNQYSSPVEQVKRYQQAGINPAVAMSSGMQSISASPSSGSPQSSPIPSGVSGLSPVGFQPSSLNIGQLMNGVGSMFRDLAQAKQLGVNTDIISQSAEYLIKNNMLTAEHKQLAVDMLRLDKVIKDETKDASISRAWDESKKAMYDALISSDEQSRQQLYSRVLESQEKLNSALANYHGKNAELLGLDISNYNSKLNAYLKLSNAQASEASAQAEQSKVTAEQTKLFNKIYSDKRYQHSIISQAVTAGQQAIDANKLTKQQVEHMNYMIEQAAYANDLKEFSYWSNQIQSYTKSIGEAASAFYGAGALRELIKMRQLSRMPVTPIQGFKQ